jgi:hypothetical protein
LSSAPTENVTVSAPFMTSTAGSAVEVSAGAVVSAGVLLWTSKLVAMPRLASCPDEYCVQFPALSYTSTEVIA